MKFIRLCLIVIVAAVATPCVAGEADAADAAFRAGDFATALALARPLAEGGDADAQLMMGLLYWRGRTVARDDRVAFEWMSKAAQRNNAEALNHLGSMYERGEGVERDAVQALRHFEQAAELGSPSGQFNTGRAYNGAIGTRRDTIRARYWYELADAHEVRGYPALVGPHPTESTDGGKRQLPDQCRPSRPPILAMNRLGLREVSGRLFFAVDGQGKVRGVRNQSLSAPELRYESVAWFSESLRSERCQLDVAMRGRAVVVPYRFVVTRW